MLVIEQCLLDFIYEINTLILMEVIKVYKICKYVWFIVRVASLSTEKRVGIPNQNKTFFYK